MPYLSRYKSRLPPDEAFKLATGNCYPLCTKVPLGCKKTAVFLVDKTILTHRDDIKCDCNGTFGTCIEARMYTIEVSQEDNKIEVLARKKIAFK